MYFLFVFDQYYPRGGWDDHHSTHATFEDAVNAAATVDADWKHIVKIQPNGHAHEVWHSGH
jgi:endonuclease I